MSLAEEIEDATQLASLTEPQWRGLVWAKLSRIEKSSAEVETQVKTTNGRVTRLETWRSMAIGALAVITAVVVPLFVKVVSQ